MIASPEASHRRNVGLVDYRVGNLGSLAGALSRQGFRAVVGDTPDALAECRALILPGVGAAPFAMDTLHRSGLARFIAEEFAAATRPIIGICLGMQLMFEHSQEGDTAGLGLLPGRARRLPDGGCHVGWTLSRTPVAAAGAGDREAAFYFNHSYYVECPAEIVTAAVRTDGGLRLPAIVRRRRFTGVQFHPEKSQAAGADLLRHLILAEPEESHA